MAFEKPVAFKQFQQEFPDAYHRIEKWAYDNFAWRNSIKCTVYAYRSKADADHNDSLAMAALTADPPENVPKDQLFGPIGQVDMNLTLLDFGRKEALTMAKTYELLAQMNEWAEAKPV